MRFDHDRVWRRIPDKSTHELTMATLGEDDRNCCTTWKMGRIDPVGRNHVRTILLYTQAAEIVRQTKHRRYVWQADDSSTSRLHLILRRRPLGSRGWSRS